MMRLSRLFLTILAAFHCFQPFTSAGGAAELLDVSAAPTNGYCIEFKIKSLAKAPVRLYNADLPWMFPQSLALSAMIPIGDGLPLKKRFDSIGVPAGSLVLQPNQTSLYNECSGSVGTGEGR